MNQPFNNLIAAGLDACGITSQLEAQRNAAARKACWQTRPPTCRDRFKQALWLASARLGHGECKRGSLRKVKLKPKRTF